MGQFQPGNPGRKPGSKGKRPAMLRALDDLAGEGVKDIIRVVVQAAQQNDIRAAEIILKRLWPEPKGRVLSVALPPLATPADLVNATTTIIAAVGAGELSPDEGHQV